MSETFITTTEISGLVLIERPTISDERGFFRESARVPDLEEVTGIPFNIQQANHAKSAKNILRGIHIAPWNKLVYVTRGTVQVVLVDVRKDSSTFGKHVSFEIGDDNKKSIFIPKGMGNSYLVLSDEVDYTYLTDEVWLPNREIGIAWDDKDLAIEWKTTEPILSEKDKHNMSFEEFKQKLYLHGLSN